MLDSEAEFSARVLEIGFPHDALEQMKSQGFNTFGKVAFATNFIPGQSDDSALITFSNNIFQIDPPSPGQLSLVRRLVYESYTMAATDLKICMERKDDDEFEQEACNLTHPFDGSSAVSDNAKRAIFFLLTEGRDKLREARESVFAHYERLADALADDEAAIHASMDPFRERLVRDKKFLLFKHMCKDAGIEDDFLVDLLVNGVKLTGVGALTSQFELDRKEPAMTEEQLMKSTRWTRRKVLGSNSSTPDAAVAKEVWKGTCDKVSRG